MSEVKQGAQLILNNEDNIREHQYRTHGIYIVNITEIVNITVLYEHIINSHGTTSECSVVKTDLLTAHTFTNICSTALTTVCNS